jgi:hypothetical protein
MVHFFIKSFFLNILIFLFRVCLYFLKHFGKIINNIYNWVSELKNKLYFQKKFTIKSNEEIANFLLLNESGKIESLYFPKIYNLSLGGDIKVLTKGIQVYEFLNTSFCMNSDFIRFDDQSIYCDKITRTENIFNKFGDIDFLNLINNEFSLIKYRNIVYFEYVFHMTGCFSKVWTHFLVQFYPKLEYLYLTPKNQSITIILPNDIDSHIISLIEYFIKDLQNINIKYVANDTQVFCRKVIYVSIDTWLSDDGPVKTIFHTQISDSTVKFILNQANKLYEKILNHEKNHSNNINNKIFIGRTGKRNIENYSQVLEYFQSLGFVEIFPHLLSIEKKIELFSSAEFITGPASSGFANIIFCRKKPLVLTLINLSRHDDMFLTKFAKIMDINYQTFIGKEKLPGYGDSDYYIEIEDLKGYVSSLIS